MKKKILLSLTLIALAASVAKSSGGLVFWGNLFSGQIAADSTAIGIDMDAPTTSQGQPTQINFVSASVVYSSVTFSSSVFDDGRAATGTITVGSTSDLSARAATNYITVASQSALAAQKATDRITVVSVAGLTGAQLIVNGTMLRATRDWTIADTATGTAVNIKNVLDSFPGIDASTAGAVVFTTASVAGLAGNSFTMTSSTPAALTVLSANFTGGRENGLSNAYLTVNGTQYLQGTLWKAMDTSSGTATSIASMLSNITGIAASAVSNVVYATATTVGTAGNSFTLTSSTPTALTVGNPTFVGGLSTASVTINGTVLLNGVDWTVGSTSSATAKSISDAIMANSTLNQIIRSTWNASAVVTTTATGVGFNYSLAAEPASAFTLSGSAMTGGLDADYVVNTPTITITGYGYPLGLSVRYSTAGTTGITGLTNQTTYYVIPVDANTLKLASSKANAVAGTYITLASSSTTGPHTFTLTPTPLTGTPGLAWQVSNDGTNWFNLSVSSITFSSPYTAGTSYWDFGQLNARYLRANEIAPTTGGWNVTVTINAKN